MAPPAQLVCLQLALQERHAGTGRRRRVAVEQVGVGLRDDVIVHITPSPEVVGVVDNVRVVHPRTTRYHHRVLQQHKKRNI